jgi:threonine/homoserine/homoserine lactone efflux protein
MLHTLLPFLAACLVIAATPGPSTALIIRQSLRDGRRSGFATVLGNESGVFLWGCAAAFGLTALVAASQLAYDVMRVAGAAILIGFGIQSLRTARRTGHGTDPAVPDGQTTSRSGSPWRSYRSGLVTNLVNPKAAVFAMSFLPQFVPPNVPALPAMVVLAAIWAVLEIGYYGAMVWFVGRARTLLSRTSVRRRMEQVSGTVLLGLGLRLAIEG